MIISLTGEVLSSRGSNSLAYDVQDAINRIEQDVKQSTSFLAVNSVVIDATNQAQSADNGTNTTNFANTGNGATSGNVLILNSVATNGNPVNTGSRNVYLSDQPNNCTDATLYVKNRPMTYNIVYFTKNNSLWRRTILPSNYNSGTSTGPVRCGDPVWQIPSCAQGYSSSFCKTLDEQLIANISSINFDLSYFVSAGSSSPITTAVDAYSSDATRATALKAATSVGVSISVSKTIAGRDISREATLRASRLDSNATDFAIPSIPASAPAAPTIASTVTDGHVVTFTWPQVPNATSYDLQYRINGGAWQTPTGTQNIPNSSRSYTVTAGNHTDVVEAQVRSEATCTTGACASAYASNSITIPLWAPLILQNGWTTYGNGYSTPSYTKTSAGVVIIKGLIKQGENASIIATLPADYRPATAKPIMFQTASSNGTDAGVRIDVRGNGEIISELANNAWLSLNNINYMAAGTTLTNLSLQNSWVNYDTTTWSGAAYNVDSLGRVHTQGLIRSGSTTFLNTIATLPSTYASQYSHMPNVNSNAYSHLSYDTSGNILFKYGGNSFLGVQAMYYPTSARATGTTCTTQWCNLTLQNSWVYYGSPYTSPQYTKSSDGIVMVKGLISSGANYATIADMPEDFCPEERLLFTVVGDNAYARVDVIPYPSTGCYLYAYTTSSSWTAIDSIIFMAE